MLGVVGRGADINGSV